MEWLRLRDGGVYVLTDGREFSAFKSADGKCYLLYAAESERHAGSPRYSVRKDGKFFSQGRTTRWTLKQLTDTGRTIG